MTRHCVGALVVLLAFVGGFFSHVFYQRWNPPELDRQALLPADRGATAGGASQSYPVSFLPLAMAPVAGQTGSEIPVVVARDVEKIRALTGKEARIRGRIFRVGHSAKSNTYFLNFGPSREALTAVIFSSGVELFEQAKQSPKNFENKEVEVIGSIRDHPQYGLEIVVETPKQIKIVN